jgi:hypothetical protein
MEIIQRVLSSPELLDQPPVLVDIGAASRLPPDWRAIAPYSIAVAFDPDEREMRYIEEAGSAYKKLYVFKRLVAAQAGKQKFFLTKSPACSSLLPPDTRRLQDWFFSDLFAVDRVVELEALDLPGVLKELSLDYLDWYKSDSQGTDLRLFQSLGKEMASQIIVAEFEPGILDAYQGEDKMHGVMAYLENLPFWLADLEVKGTPRLTKETFAKEFGRFDEKVINVLLKPSAFWGEMAYLNTFAREDMRSRRRLLLGWVCAFIKKHYGFALELAYTGKALYGDPRFDELREQAVKAIKKNRIKIPFYLLGKLYKRIIARYF